MTIYRQSIDPYSRLRVPKYQKMFEALFFAAFLALYYAVLLERHPERVGIFEILLYIWIAAFTCEEFGEFRDAGTLFYTADFWSLWDLGIILVGFAFLIASECSPFESNIAKERPPILSSYYGVKADPLRR